DDIKLGLALDEAASSLLHRGPVEVAEAAREGDELVVAERLPAEEQHRMLDPGVADRGELRIADGAQIDPADLGADAAGGRRHGDWRMGSSGSLRGHGLSSTQPLTPTLSRRGRGGATERWIDPSPLAGEGGVFRVQGTSLVNRLLPRQIDAYRTVDFPLS